jgi:tryptophan synthase alpha chain
VSGLEEPLADLRRSGRKALVVYLVGGMTEDWLDAAHAASHAGCDLLEIGVPFSDPIMDGPVIQAGAEAALSRGTTWATVLADAARLTDGPPRLVMTYYNLVHHRGLERAAADLTASGMSGALLPDLALEESGEWRSAANAQGQSCVLMAAPSTPEDRVAQLVGASQGFLYVAARMAVTGAASDDGPGAAVVELARRHGDLPLYLGIGISTARQAAAAAEVADGVIVGSAIVRRLLDGEGPAGVERFVSDLRRAIS